MIDPKTVQSPRFRAFLKLLPDAKLWEYTIFISKMVAASKNSLSASYWGDEEHKQFTAFIEHEVTANAEKWRAEMRKEL